jgi:hypothetical protein
MTTTSAREPSIFLFIALFALLHQGVQAQPYKCTVEGKTVYQQARCEGGSSVNVSGAGKADPTSPATAQLQREIAAIKRKELVEDAIHAGKIFVGMTADEVILSWGRPSKINATISGRGRSEQWIYRRGRIGDDQYVYVDNGVVTSMQSPQ